MAQLREEYSARPVGADANGQYKPGDPWPSAEETPPARSLIDDLEALVDDGRTYLDAELSYQKTRASFVSNRLKNTIIYAVGAAVIGFVAFIGLTVGLIIALTPLVTGWGATAIVVGLLLIVAYLLVQRALKNWRSGMGAVRSPSNGAAQNDREGGL